LSPLNPHRLAELSIPFLHQLAEELPAVAGLLLKNESRPDSSPPYDAVVEEVTHQEAVEAVEVAVEAVEVAVEAEERRLLRSPRPRPRRLSLKQPTSEPWEPPQEYSKAIEPKRRTSSMNSDITTESTGELPDLIPL
jgi:hypothetical protein